jgi:hypothetical protein
MSWFGRLLCRLGLHNLEQVHPELDRELARFIPYKIVCRRCGKGY